jgi:hypothetical protein
MINKEDFVKLSLPEIANLYPLFESKSCYVDSQRVKNITGYDLNWPDENITNEHKYHFYDILQKYYESNSTIKIYEKGENKVNMDNSNNNMFSSFIDNNVDLSKIKLTINGLGVESDDGTIKIYKKGKIIDVTQFTLQNSSISSMIFLMPTKKVKAGDLIVNNGTFVFVVNDDGGSIKVIDFNNNSERTIVRQQHLLIPFSFVTKVYSPFTGSSIMNNMLPMMMMNNSNGNNGGMMNNMLPMMMMSKILKNNSKKEENDNNETIEDDEGDLFDDMNNMFNMD